MPHKRVTERTEPGGANGAPWGMAGGRLLACWACAALLSLTRSAEASPRVSFWTEVSPADALRLARNASLLSSLASSRAAVRVAVRDLSKERAEFHVQFMDMQLELYSQTRGK